MKYIVKNGKIFGIAANEWNNTAGIPTINSTILGQGNNYTSADLNIIKHMTKAEYDALQTKNPNCYYVVSTDTSIVDDDIQYLDLKNKPSINDVILTGNKSLRDLNLYSIDEIDNMMASLRAIKVVATKPATADIIPNTLYYVGTSAPYHVYLYDSNKTEADLGDSNIDFSNFYTKTECDNKYLDKQNFLNNLYPKGTIYTTYENKNPSTFLGGTWVLIGGQDANLNYYPAFAIATDTEGTTISESLPTITGSYRVGRNQPLTNIKTTDETSPTTADGCFSITQEETQMILSTTYGTSVKPKALNFDASNSSSIYKNNAHVNVNAIKIFFWRRTDDAPVVFNTGNITMDTTLSPQSTNDHIPTSKAVVDYTDDNFASINTSFAKNVGGYHGNIDNAVFNFGDKAISWGRAKDTRTYTQMALVDPIDGSILYGYVETTQTVVFTYQTMIEQTFTTFFRVNGEGMANGILKRFKRTGYYDSNIGSVLANPYTNSALITWKDWYPVEYPSFEIARNTTNTTSGVICALISGSTLKIEIEAMKLASAPGGNSVIIANLPTNLNNVLKSWPGGATYYRGFAFNVNATTAHSGLVQVYKNDGKIYVFGNFVANENIWGSIVATLGY